MRQIWTFARRRRKVVAGIVVLNAAFILLTAGLIYTNPVNDPGNRSAPDEFTHYHYNVEFIIEHHRLPVSGKDDLDAYRTCPEIDFDRIPCTISYNMYPQFNYVVSAAFAAVGHVFGMDYARAARLASLAWGLVFLNTIIAIALLFAPGRIGLALAFAVGFIPQIVFISSYVNQDIHSLALAALATLATILLMRRATVGRILFFGAAFGSLFLAKYNYLVLPVALAVLLGVARLSHRVDSRDLRRIAGAAVGGALLISGFWYIRNVSLYGDPLGQSFMLRTMSKYHALGQSRGLSAETLQWLINKQFLETTVQTFFATFGSVTVHLPATVTQFLQIGVVVLPIFFVIDVARSQERELRYACLAFALLCCGVAALFLYNTLRFDYQPQGRYLFPIIPPLVALVAYACRVDRRFHKYVTIGVCTTTYLLISSIAALTRFYYPLA